MTIEFSCPGCERVLKTSDDKAGRRAKCPQCGEAVTVPAAHEPELFDDGFDLFDAEVPAPEDQSFLSRPVSPAEIDCPMCGAANRHNALVCDYCGEVIRRTVNQKWEPNQIKVGEVFSRSWQLYTENLGLCIAVPFLASLLGGVTVLVLGLVGFAIVTSTGVLLANNGPLAILAAGVGFLIFFIALVIILNYLEAGTQIVLLKIALGEETELGDLFTGGRFVLRLILCGLLFNLVVGIGNAIFFLIGLFL
ncbi:MAG: hypothetical protein KDA74_03285, partial [Planctomycetaceae bacterium]|nr:hypothetical protein [Planctomycetaceae bacterium]